MIVLPNTAHRTPHQDEINACEGSDNCDPRLLIVDSNIEGLKGHFLELALVISEAAKYFGYSTTLLTSSDFPSNLTGISGVKVVPTFSCHKIRRWSLGPHGYSRVRRDLYGNPDGDSLLSRVGQRIVDRLHGTPAPRVLQQTVNELAQALIHFDPRASDHILFSTCDDFILLVAAAALNRIQPLPRLNVSFLWHNSARPGRACEPWLHNSRQKEAAIQIEVCLEAIQSHQLMFFATTEELCQQYGSLFKQGLWQAIDYPIRDVFEPESATSSPSVQLDKETASQVSLLPTPAANRDAPTPLRAVCGGAQRSEKGVRSLAGVVKTLWNDFLAPGNIRLGLQMDSNAVAKIIPRNDSSVLINPIDLAPPSMDANAYLKWIQSADIGLFLYDSRRYYTRCSGVLIEMLACGNPVIVPAGCWLSRQIAKPNHQYLETLNNNLADTNVPLEFTSSNLLANPSEACEAWIKHDSDSSLVTFSACNGSNDSYLAIEEAWQDSNGTLQTHWHVLELHNQNCHLLLRHHKYQIGKMNTTRLRAWSPYGEHQLKIAAACLKPIAANDTSIAAASLGTTFARIEDLPHCFYEVQTHYASYKSNVVHHQRGWKTKHSGKVFITKLLNQTGRESDEASSTKAKAVASLGNANL